LLTTIKLRDGAACYRDSPVVLAEAAVLVSAAVLAEAEAAVSASLFLAAVVVAVVEVVLALCELHSLVAVARLARVLGSAVVASSGVAAPVAGSSAVPVAVCRRALRWEDSRRSVDDWAASPAAGLYWERADSVRYDSASHLDLHSEPDGRRSAVDRTAFRADGLRWGRELAPAG
jgi:hypothetical protein